MVGLELPKELLVVDAQQTKFLNRSFSFRVFVPKIGRDADGLRSLEDLAIKVGCRCHS